MPGQTPKQKRIVGRVMHEFKEGALARANGSEVKSPKQAIAIALSEAGDSNRRSPKRNRDALTHTKAVETRAVLYEEAKQAGVKGRSKMTKEQLRHAVAR